MDFRLAVEIGGAVRRVHSIHFESRSDPLFICIKCGGTGSAFWSLLDGLKLIGGRRVIQMWMLTPCHHCNGICDIAFGRRVKNVVH